MSSKMTRIRVPGNRNSDTGYLDWGERTRAEMIEIMRHRAAHLRAAADAIDSTSDENFEVDIVRGSIVQHHVRRVP